MVNEPPFHCQGDPARRGNMEFTLLSKHLGLSKGKELAQFY